jgi:hypothetical protein
MELPKSVHQHDKQRNWRRPVAVIGSAVLGMSVLSGCSLAFWEHDATKSAESPALSQDLVNQLRGLGTQAAKDYLTNGSGLDTSLRAFNLGHTLFINYVAPDGYQYAEDIEHSTDEVNDGRITEPEMNQITCIVEAPKTMNGVIEGKTILTKQPNGTWTEDEAINLLSGKPNVCNYVERVLEPVEDPSN